jgi:putative DNA primase/helicase
MNTSIPQQPVDICAEIDGAVKRGWALTPVNGKRPINPGWQNEEPQSADDLKEHATQGGNIGLRTGSVSGVVALDYDLDKGGLIPPELEGVKTPTVITPHGCHQYFQAPSDVKITNSASKLGPHLDVRGENGQTVFPGSKNQAGTDYRWWLGLSPDDVPLQPLPQWVIDKLAKPTPPRASSSGNGQHKPAPTNGVGHGVPQNNDYVFAALHGELELIRNAPEGTRNNQLNTSSLKVGSLLCYSTITRQEAGEKLLKAALESGLEESESIATIRSGLRAGLANPREADLLKRSTDAPDGVSEVRLTDLTNAERFRDSYSNDIKHISSIGWIAWDGQRWAQDAEKGAHRLAHTVGGLVRKEFNNSGCVDPALAAMYARWERSSRSASRIHAMLSEARCLTGIDGDALELDSHEWLFNVPNGCVDLRTGELLPHDRQHFITRLSPVVYKPEATAPRFELFLREIFQGDEELIGYWQWCSGLSITGCRDYALFFIEYGGGSNGKTVEAGIRERILGPDYAHALPAEALLMQKHAQHPTEIAQLRGKRFVHCAETPQGRRLNEPLLKLLSGGDRVRARLMSRDSFEFRPEGTIFLHTNSKPVIHDASEGLWRRLRLIPFLAKFTPDKCDPHLLDRLWSERSGILNWLVSGARRVQHGEPALPPCVRKATDQYRASEDLLGDFLSECTELAPHDVVTVDEMHAAFLEHSGIKTLSKKALAAMMLERGHGRVRTKNTRSYKGLRLVG